MQEAQDVLNPGKAAMYSSTVLTCYSQGGPQLELESRALPQLAPWRVPAAFSSFAGRNSAAP